MISQRKKEAMPEFNQRTTPVPFSSEEARKIGDEIAAGGTTPCPRCDGHLDLEEPLDRGDGTLIRAVYCEACGRTTILVAPARAPSG